MGLVFIVEEIKNNVFNTGGSMKGNSTIKHAPRKMLNFNVFLAQNKSHFLYYSK